VKSYRYANLLAIVVTLFAGFMSVADQTKMFFVVPTTELDGQPFVYSDTDINLTKIEPIKKGDIPTIATSPKIIGPVATVQSTPAITICSSYYGYITIGGKTICLTSTNTTAGSLSYSNGYIYNSNLSQNKFIFGHNSGNLFGNLKSLSSGTVFYLTLGGQTTAYRITFKESVCDYTNPGYPCSNYPESVLNMNDAIQPSRRGADLAIMTCDGTPIGNGDATHRLVVYATKI